MAGVQRAGGGGEGKVKIRARSVKIAGAKRDLRDLVVNGELPRHHKYVIDGTPF